MQSLVDELDQPSEQVAITAVFARYDLGKDRSFGVDLGRLLTGDSDFRGAFQNRNGVPSVIDPDTLLDFNSLLELRELPQEDCRLMPLSETTSGSL